MYKLLLSWRYLRTRWIALASIISVMLGVATMIVVNSVMAGFTLEMQNRIHSILSDLVVTARSLEGVPDAQWHMEQLREVAGDEIESMTPTVIVPAMLSFQHDNNWITRQVQLIGIDETTQGTVSDFSLYLQHPENRRKMTFNLREDGYDTGGLSDSLGTPSRPQMADAGWQHRRRMASLWQFEQRLSGNGNRVDQPEPQRGPVEMERSPDRPSEPGASPLDVASRFTPPTESPAAPDTANPTSDRSLPPDPFAARQASEPEKEKFDPATEQHTGAVLGIALSAVRLPSGEDGLLLLPGDDVKLTFPTAGAPPQAISDTFTVVDFYESKMSEYDSGFVFVPIRKLQELRGMIDPSTDVGYISAIQIKLKPGVDGDEVRDRLRAAFDPHLYSAETWRDRQGPLLAAVDMETTILNILLFLIIAVAGFGILAIFLMIVIEKTRDIGILKSLGASKTGVMGIFLGYGLSLGIVGSGVGTVLGLLFVKHINEIADLLGAMTGRPVFDPSVYYFYKIPATVDPWTVSWIVGGALVIAVLASVLPAMRAATMHPVEALRYE